MQLSDIKGLGAKRIEKLAECGIRDPLDLLLLFPVKYYDRRAIVDWDGLAEGEEVIFKGRLIGRPFFRRVRKGMSVTKASFDADGRTVNCTWFNQDYIMRALDLSGERVICGKVHRVGNKTEISAPQFVTERDVDVLPIYRLPKKLTQGVIYDAISYVVRHLEIKGYVDNATSSAFNMLPLSEAFVKVHFPSSIEEAREARRSVALENLAYTMCAYELIRSGKDVRSRAYAGGTETLAPALAALPFLLTGEQTRAISDIIDELRSPHRANILLYGDVGSGKTAVAFLAMYYAARSGYQSAIMAPTEILARQHYAKAKSFFGGLGMEVVCVLGSQSRDERAAALDALATGRAQIAVGTHALIGGSVVFRSLGLTVTDEQHRFGVCQRGSLENKTTNADNIVMSATPIPRTLAMVLYGQLRSIRLNERPAGKNDTVTAIVPRNKIADMYGYVRERSALGEKTYIVCPRVDSEDGTSAVALYDELRKGALRGEHVVLLHGKQKEKEKDAAMEAFAHGDANVLVGTTVIEVGIDVPAATIMIIYGAEYFGLSQLHQLRGRIGRDGRRSYCFLVSDGATAERLEFFRNCTDGFRLAEYDFEKRGAGDFFGTRQHGRGDAFADISVDRDMVAAARRLADKLLSDGEISAAIAASAENKSEFIRSLSLD